MHIRARILQKPIISNPCLNGVLLRHLSKNTPLFKSGKMSKDKELKDTYEKMKQSGYNTVDNIIEWMRSANIFENSKEAENKTRKKFAETDSKSKVDFEKLQGVVKQMAAENKKTVEDITKKMETQGPKIFDALKAAAKAFEDTLKKK